MERRQTILVIDDDEMIRRLVSVRLESLGADVVCAESGDDGLAIASRGRVDLVLLDVDMPGLDGFEVCRRLREDPANSDTPVIFLTGSDDTHQKARGFDLGAIDYVTKPFDVSELRARVRSALRTQALLYQLEMQAQTDHLTGLINRDGFSRCVSRSLDRSASQPGYQFAILFLDLDRFKVVNDSLGHTIGDRLLVDIAHKLRSAVRETRDGRGRTASDVVARLGGDEFAVLLEDLSDTTYAPLIAERLQRDLAEPLELGGYQVKVSASIGIRYCRDADETVDALLRDSDIAMYRAKAGGRAKHVVFDPRMHTESVDRMRVEHELRASVESERFGVEFQPIVDIHSGRLAGFEALIRWERPGVGRVLPDAFITVAEETGMIHGLSRWCVLEVCEHVQRWEAAGIVPDGFMVSINFSPVYLGSPTVIDDMIEALERTGVEPHRIAVEVTESAIMSDTQKLVEVLGRLRRLGLRIAMDDFGTGHSSLAMLNELPIDAVKIDMEFIHAMTRSRAHSAIVSTIIVLADNLGLTIVAEGIESEYQVVQLQTMDCQLGQGYFFSHPVSGEEARRLLVRSGEFPIGPGSLASIRGE